MSHSQRVHSTNLFLMVGLPGAGKTTRAKELAVAHRALRLTPDGWMIALFDGTQPDGKRDLLEGLLITVALQTLRLGTSVVLDFGLWSRDERSALRWLGRSAGAACQVIYLPVDEAVQRARVARTVAPELISPVCTPRGVTRGAGPHHGPHPAGTWPAPARPPPRQTAANGESLAATRGARNEGRDNPRPTYGQVH